MGLQAVGWRRAGDMSRALPASDAAIEVSQRYDERWCRPELMRIKGEVLRDRGEISRAQELFEAAIQEAQESGARGWELRAATDLGQLWIGLGKREAARAILGKICDQFSEGFETSDLKAALRLLRDLG